MKRSDVDIFEKLSGQIISFYDEISVLSKKSPNDAINVFKLKLINKVLVEANAFLDARYRPFEDFAEFNPDDLPQNSDVVFILSQYLQCFEKCRSDNVAVYLGVWQWQLTPEKGEKPMDNGFVYLRTTKPKNLRD
jgi:hypothetical protein